MEATRESGGGRVAIREEREEEVALWDADDGERREWTELWSLSSGICMGGRVGMAGKERGIELAVGVDMVDSDGDHGQQRAALSLHGVNKSLWQCFGRRRRGV